MPIRPDAECSQVSPSALLPMSPRGERYTHFEQVNLDSGIAFLRYQRLVRHVFQPEVATVPLVEVETSGFECVHVYVWKLFSFSLLDRWCGPRGVLVEPLHTYQSCSSSSPASSVCVSSNGPSFSSSVSLLIATLPCRNWREVRNQPIRSERISSFLALEDICFLLAIFSRCKGVVLNNKLLPRCEFIIV